jgi:hypothetical protein
MAQKACIYPIFGIKLIYCKILKIIFGLLSFRVQGVAQSTKKNFRVGDKNSSYCFATHTTYLTNGKPSVHWKYRWNLFCLSSSFQYHRITWENCNNGYKNFQMNCVNLSSKAPSIPFNWDNSDLRSPNEYTYKFLKEN